MLQVLGGWEKPGPHAWKGSKKGPTSSPLQHCEIPQRARGPLGLTMEEGRSLTMCLQKKIKKRGLTSH